mmetsp:Transcript_33630/g.57438  ORF Transcript_33630/g.57438 Transcript_33630/m.57438 type:complete len:98 (-) Transcript_33630:43-336(-)
MGAAERAAESAAEHPAHGTYMRRSRRDTLRVRRLPAHGEGACRVRAVCVPCGSCRDGSARVTWPLFAQDMHCGCPLRCRAPTSAWGGCVPCGATSVV